ncbi:MAG: menaquinone-dependent protoporphyrinogen IX dehydrogenase, partial [Gammaproteobacteria bacterium]|nr:menaquinone-dependent protoporphyrinogen IX dehydrogenase [Gammaproteobacteria bacterium]
MSEILIIYSTTDGHTRVICEHIRHLLTEQNNIATLVSVKESSTLNIACYDKLVIGASIRYGKHPKNIYHFIEKHRQTLKNKPSAFFSVNLVARKPDKNTPDTNPYFKRFINKIPWKPDRVAVFAGKLNYPIYNIVDKQIIRLIMWVTKGPTHPDTVKEYTDWQ